MKSWRKDTATLEPEASEDPAAFSMALVFLTLGFSLSAFSIVYWELGQSLMLTSGLIGISVGGWKLHQYLGQIAEVEAR
ncbi:hypothetical protein [Cerasicoccus maritimus]|uniref:hypothetical protein n=1 Tax=Cerasicoccus maritimus TaxID=490089 RepID=UPI0028525E03|nr:hypothetical protein [Cerasicoccus maritimus]